MDRRQRSRLRAVAIAGAVGVVVYVASWVLAGILWPGYDPTRQAISELFASGAPTTSARLLVGALVATGALLVAFGWMLHRVMPGEAIAGPVAVTLSGVGTFLVPLIPCSPGCPGAGSTPADTWHTIVAGGGYLALVIAPLLFSHRLWRPDPTLARTSLAFGLAAGLGFAAYVAGLGSTYGGLLQRVFNTTADAWLVVMAVAALNRLGSRGRQRELEARSH